MNQHFNSVHGLSVDLHHAKGFESVFPEPLIDFHTSLNFTKSEEEVFQLLSALSRQCGFDAIVYEYCPDIHAGKPDLFMRTDLPKAFEALERSAAKQSKLGYSRQHGLAKWTPTVAGYEFADLYSEYPNQVWKYRLAALVSGLRSGFGVPLRSPDPASRAGLGFASKLPRKEFDSLFQAHRFTLYTAAWAGHIRILQHARTRSNKPSLTGRQLSYLKLLAKGLLDKQIAHALEISHSAVRKHQYAVARRFGVERRNEIVNRAIEYGIIPNPSESENHPSVDWDLRVV